MEGLLVSLRKYRPRENSDPVENFITEAFAWLLRSSDEVQKAVLDLVNVQLQEPIPITLKDLAISTQENFNGKFPDMVWRGDNEAIVFEHKVNSELHKNQLNNYRDFIKENVNDYRLVLITARKSQHAQGPDVALCWKQVYKCLHLLLKGMSDEKLSWSINEFLELLKSEGLGPVNPVNPFAIKNYQEAIKLVSQLNSMIYESKNNEWPLSKSYEIDTYHKYERIGLNFTYKGPDGKATCLPGILCGFMLDGSDCKAPDLFENGLNATVLVSFNKKGQEIYHKSAFFKGFLGELRDSVSKVTGWELSDRTQKGLRLNKWHPIIIHKPMIDFFENKTTTEEQLAVYFNEMTAIQNCILSCPSYDDLISDLYEEANSSEQCIV